MDDWRSTYRQRMDDIEKFSEDANLTPEQKTKLYGIASDLFNLPMFIYAQAQGPNTERETNEANRQVREMSRDLDKRRLL